MPRLSPDTVNSLHTVLKHTGDFALKHRHEAVVQYKPDKTPFTDLELYMETILIDFLHQTFPDDQMITEENGVLGIRSRNIWALDPIDGTKIFLNGLPTWCISLGLIEDTTPSFGAIYMPVSGDLFWGGPGYGAWHNDSQLGKDQDLDFDHPLVFLGVPANAQLHYDIRYPSARSFGSTAVHLAFLATGAAIGVLTRRINLWDIAGALPLRTETGVEVNFLSGKPLITAEHLDGKKFPEELLAARPINIEKLRAVIVKKD